MEKTILCLFYLLIMANGQANYILDGDFENFINDANPTSGTWYNAINQSSTFFVRTIDGSKALELKANPKKVCQNITLPFQATYRITYFYKSSTSSITLSLIVDDTTILSRNPQYNYLRQEVDLHLARGFHKVCFNRTTSNQKVYIDNMTLEVFGNITLNYNETCNQKVTYYAFENSQTFNSIKVRITFQDLENRKFWLNQEVQKKVQITINQKVVDGQRIKQLENHQDYVLLSVVIQETLTPDSPFSLIIPENSFGINCTFMEARQGQLPSVLYQSAEDQKTIKAVSAVANSISQIMTISILGIVVGGATYFISSLFAFSHIICLYNYVQLKWVLLPYRVIINKFLEMFLVHGDITNLIYLLFGKRPSIQIEAIPEKISKSQNIDGMLEHGFSSSFLANSLDELINLLFLMIRLSIVFALCSIPITCLRNNCSKILRKTHLYILYEILAGAPTVILPIGFVFTGGLIGYLNIQSKLNSIAMIFYSFILFFVPFLLHHYEIRSIKEKKKKKKKKIKEREDKKQQSTIKSSQISEKKDKNDQMAGKQDPKEKKDIKISPQNTKKQEEKKPIITGLKELRLPAAKIKCNIDLIENFLLFIIPFLIGLRNVNIFICASMVFMLLRLILIISKRHLFDRWEFFKNLFNRLTWLSFNTIFLFYWLMEKVNCWDIPTNLQVADKLGLGSVIIITIGMIAQAIFLLIDFFIWLKEKIKKCCTCNKIADDPKNNPAQEDKSQQKSKKKQFTCKVQDLSESNDQNTNNNPVQGKTINLFRFDYSHKQQKQSRLSELFRFKKSNKVTQLGEKSPQVDGQTQIKFQKNQSSKI